MPLSLVQGADIASNATFQRRVAMAMYYGARAVMTEKRDVDGHPLRVSFARGVLGQDWSEMQQYASMVVTDSRIVNDSKVFGIPLSAQDRGTLMQDQVADATVVAIVSSMWSALAGVEPPAV